jgi:hypothetical protein
VWKNRIVFLGLTSFALLSGVALAENAPGIADSEIKIGQTMPYSGPASAYSAIGKVEIAFFAMVNDNGGVSRRRINLISLDDGYSPPKTLERTRKLIEQGNVAFIFGSRGTPTNSASTLTNGKSRSSSLPLVRTSLATISISRGLSLATLTETSCRCSANRPRWSGSRHVELCSEVGRARASSRCAA